MVSADSYKQPSPSRGLIHYTLLTEATNTTIVRYTTSPQQISLPQKALRIKASGVNGVSHIYHSTAITTLINEVTDLHYTPPLVTGVSHLLFPEDCSNHSTAREVEKIFFSLFVEYVPL